MRVALLLLGCGEVDPLCRSPLGPADANCDGVDDRDADGDGDAGVLAGGTDCDDADPALHGLDLDADGWPSCAGDCADDDPLRGPRGVAPEICDDVDNDCNDVVDVDDLGSSPCARSQRFERPERVKLDVLFVVDSRTTMYDELGRLPAAGPALLAPLVGTDTHLAVTSNVASRHGRFHGAEGGALWLDLEEETLETASAWWALASDLDARGEHDNASFQSAQDAIVLEGDGANLGFRRDDAPLVYVFASDTDDASATSADAFAIFTRDPVWFPTPAVAHAIVPVGSGLCAAGEAPRFAIAVPRTAGRLADVCLEDWSTFLGEIALDEAPAYEVRVKLDLVPIPATLSATVQHLDGRLETIGADALVWEPFAGEVVVPQYPWGELAWVRIDFQVLPEE